MTTVIKNFLMDTSSYTRVNLNRLENPIARKNPLQKNEEYDQDLPQLVLEVIVLS
jgi:hypothetical protein